MSSGWDWELPDRTKRELGDLDEYAQERIVSKLDEIVDDPWREPTDYVEPVQGSPNSNSELDSSGWDAALTILTRCCMSRESANAAAMPTEGTTNFLMLTWSI